MYTGPLPMTDDNGPPQPGDKAGTLVNKATDVPNEKPKEPAPGSAEPQEKASK